MLNLFFLVPAAAVALAVHYTFAPIVATMAEVMAALPV